MRRLLTASAMLPWLILPSCGDGDTEGAGKPLPDTLARNVRRVTVSAAGRVEIDAETVETYTDEDTTVFLNARIEETDPQGEPVLQGGADRIELQGNDDGSASGNIMIRNLTEDSRLEAEKLNWTDAERLLSGEGKVTVELGDGLTVSGERFQADMARETYEFSGGVQGTLEID